MNWSHWTIADCLAGRGTPELMLLADSPGLLFIWAGWEASRSCWWGSCLGCDEGSHEDSDEDSSVAPVHSARKAYSVGHYRQVQGLPGGRVGQWEEAGSKVCAGHKGVSRGERWKNTKMKQEITEQLSWRACMCVHVHVCASVCVWWDMFIKWISSWRTICASLFWGPGSSSDAQLYVLPSDLPSFSLWQLETLPHLNQCLSVPPPPPHQVPPMQRS